MNKSGVDEYEARRVRVVIETKLGAVREMEFFLRDDDVFPVTVTHHLGYPQAQLGGVTIKLPRWEASGSWHPE